MPAIASARDASDTVSVRFELRSPPPLTRPPDATLPRGEDGLIGQGCIRYAGALTIAPSILVAVISSPYPMRGQFRAVRIDRHIICPTSGNDTGERRRRRIGDECPGANPSRCSCCQTCNGRHLADRRSPRQDTGAIRVWYTSPVVPFVAGNCHMMLVPAAAATCRDRLPDDEP